jgi:Fe-Mn family superoxide dismutase
MMTRRQAIRNALITGAALTTIPSLRGLAAESPAPASAPDVGIGPFKLPPLPYAFDALEPYIDAKTMEIHHDKHHAGYVKKLNAAVQGHPDLAQKTPEELLRNLDAVPEDIRKTVRNNGGGDYNHTLFWQMMKPKGGGEPKGALGDAIAKKFGSFSGFKEKFSKEAGDVFGSGWAWLVLSDRELAIESTANQDSPISQGKTPLLGIDVWEHAYYLKRQNRRPEYIEAWWNVVNWDFVSQRYSGARS